MPTSWTPRTETEKALHDSLRAMELQCKERVDLLDALRKSREEADEEAKSGSNEALPPALPSRSPNPSSSYNNSSSTWLGNDTVPQANYADLPKPQIEKRPAQSKRPSFMTRRISDRGAAATARTHSVPDVHNLPPPQHLTPPTAIADAARGARTPSPEKKSSGGMLRTLRSQPKEKTTNKMATTLRTQPAAARAATQVWNGAARLPSEGNSGAASAPPASTTTPAWDPYTRQLVERPHPSARSSAEQQRQSDPRRSSAHNYNMPEPGDYLARHSGSSTEDLTPRPRQYPPPYPDYPVLNPFSQNAYTRSHDSVDTARLPPPAPPAPPPHLTQPRLQQPVEAPRPAPTSLAQAGPSSLSYMKEYPNHPPKPKVVAPAAPPPPKPAKPVERVSEPKLAARPAATLAAQAKSAPAIPRKAITNEQKAANILGAMANQKKNEKTNWQMAHGFKADANPNDTSSNPGTPNKAVRRKPDPRPTAAAAAAAPSPRVVTPPTTDESHDSDGTPNPDGTSTTEWEARVARIMANLPKGVDEAAAKQIFNEIVIQGDEVHWDDVAGLEVAKSALKETVVYPFLRPDLFLGLREPARGMLLFGPPGTGKTMLARAVATESRSVFFAISASSLTSKFLGESEKLVRALFALARALAPSIIFVDEIDSLLGARGAGSEHEATRRIKTEFLIQWSDLQRAAAGREPVPGEGDAMRVLVLAATNLPWAIDEAARRRFVRRQYIPLPEAEVREKQLRTLLKSQKHRISERDMQVLVGVTEGEFFVFFSFLFLFFFLFFSFPRDTIPTDMFFRTKIAGYSGSDITALAKDAAMGPLRSLGERLLHMSPEEIRPIDMRDFEASLVNIRPSVSKQGLKEFEDWAREFGERGG